MLVVVRPAPHRVVDSSEHLLWFDRPADAEVPDVLSYSVSGLLWRGRCRRFSALSSASLSTNWYPRKSNPCSTVTVRVFFRVQPSPIRSITFARWARAFPGCPDTAGPCHQRSGRAELPVFGIAPPFPHPDPASSGRRWTRAATAGCLAVPPLGLPVCAVHHRCIPGLQPRPDLTQYCPVGDPLLSSTISLSCGTVSKAAFQIYFDDAVHALIQALSALPVSIPSHFAGACTHTSTRGNQPRNIGSLTSRVAV